MKKEPFDCRRQETALQEAFSKACTNGDGRLSVEDYIKVGLENYIKVDVEDYIKVEYI